MVVYCGLDYSMSGPALTVCDGDFHINNCKIYFLTGTKKYQNNYCNDKIIGKGFIENHKNDIERYSNISDYFMNIINQYDSKDIKFMIEGYAMASHSGLVFNIAEHTAIMKYKLYLHNIEVQTVPPSAVKKFATGSGKAKKNQMYESFNKETSIDLLTEMSYNKVEIVSPISDIVDSYFICKRLFSD